MFRVTGLKTGFFRKIKAFAAQNVVMLIAFLAAAVTMFFVPPDGQYVGYFDFKTLSCLFCVLAAVCALKNIGFFRFVSYNIVKGFGTIRRAVLALIYITFIGSMLIANDMALITFLPLGYFILSTTNKKELMAFTFIMQNIAANLGGMLTPFGNPQNLFLYTKFSIPTFHFMKIMAPHFLLSVALITVCCFIFIKDEAVTVGRAEFNPPLKKTVLYLSLFALSIAIVFRGIPYVVGLIVVPIVLLFADRKALKSVDYPLLFTFVFFFVFSGNMSRIPEVREFFSFLLSKNTLLFSVISCQVISNVPSAILLSSFTENYAHLLVGVNIGGVGTLISSLASLITLREYTALNPKKVGSYILKFSAFNFAFLIILAAFALLIM